MSYKALGILTQYTYHLLQIKYNNDNNNINLCALKLSRE